jgi:hypothetical protein
MKQLHFCADKKSRYPIGTINLMDKIISVKRFCFSVYSNNDPKIFCIIFLVPIMKRYILKIIFAHNQVGYLKRFPHILYTQLHRFRPICGVPLFFLATPRIFIIRGLLKPFYINETLFVFGAPTIVVLKICLQ